MLFLLSQVMLDTVGPELQVVNKIEKTISLVADGFVVLTPHQDQEASSELLPINFDGLAKVKHPSSNYFVMLFYQFIGLLCRIFVRNWYLCTY